MHTRAIDGDARSRQHGQLPQIHPGAMDVPRPDADFGNRRGLGKLMEIFQVLGRVFDQTSRCADAGGQPSAGLLRCVHDVVEAAPEIVPAVAAAQTRFDDDLLLVRLQPQQHLGDSDPHFLLWEGKRSVRGRCPGLTVGNPGSEISVTIPVKTASYRQADWQGGSPAGDTAQVHPHACAARIHRTNRIRILCRRRKQQFRLPAAPITSRR